MVVWWLSESVLMCDPNVASDTRMRGLAFGADLGADDAPHLGYGDEHFIAT